MKRNKRVLVAANDAGGAEIIGAYVRTHQDGMRYDVYAGGPAARVFKRLGVPFKKIADDEQKIAAIVRRHADADYALFGTGEMTRIESRAVLAAKDAGVRTIIYLDSWVNYLGRFGFPQPGWKENLPDELWIGDTAGQRLAEEAFPGLRIRLVPNWHFADIAEAFKKQESAPDEILFFGTSTEGSPEALEGILEELSRAGERISICVRLHPAEPVTRYDALIERYKRTFRIRKSRTKDLVSDLARARIVAGLETMALALAYKVGIRAVCVVPRGTAMTLPFARIRRAGSGQEAARMIAGMLDIRLRDRK